MPAAAARRGRMRGRPARSTRRTSARRAPRSRPGARRGEALDGRCQERRGRPVATEEAGERLRVGEVEPAAAGDHQLAPDGRHALEDRHRDASGRQHVRGHQPRRPASHDGHGRLHPTLSRRASLASVARPTGSPGWGLPSLWLPVPSALPVGHDTAKYDEPRGRGRQVHDDDQAGELQLSATLASALASAFSEDPLFTWMAGAGPTKPLEPKMRTMFDAFLRIDLAKPDHLVFIDEDGIGAAIWKQTNKWKLPNGEMVRAMPEMLHTFGTRVPKMIGALSAIEKGTEGRALLPRGAWHEEGHAEQGRGLGGDGRPCSNGATPRACRRI